MIVKDLGKGLEPCLKFFQENPWYADRLHPGCITLLRRTKGSTVGRWKAALC